jgi:glycerophosphoryl diester phosphodiesterase
VLLLLASGVFLFSFQYQILENMKFKEAVKESRKLLKGETVREVSGILWRYLLLAILFLAFYVVLLLAAAFMIRAVSPEAARVTVYLTASRYIGSLYAILLYFFFTPFGFSIIAGIYFSQKEKHGDVPKPYPYCTAPRRQRRLEDIVLAAALFAGIVLNYGMILDTISGNVQSNIQAIRMPMISAHRGSSEQAPENTLAAIAAASEDMADYAEIDVRATSDGVVVLLHDENLKRTTGLKKMIWNITYEDASQLSMSKWYNGNLVTEKIPTLDDVLKFASHRIRLNIEIKASPHSPRLVESVVDIIRENGFEDQCVISSFDYSVLSEVKRLDSDLKTGIIITAAIANYTNLPDVDFYSMSSVFLSKSKVESLHLRGYEVFAWGVNDTNTMRRMISIGVDNMIVSDPLIAKKIVYADNANLIVMRIGDAVFGTTDIKEKSVVKIFLPYW